MLLDGADQIGGLPLKGGFSAAAAHVLAAPVKPVGLSLPAGLVSKADGGCLSVRLLFPKQVDPPLLHTNSYSKEQP